MEHDVTRIKVLHVSESACAGGAQNVMKQLVMGLSDFGFETMTALPDDGVLFSEFEDAGIETFNLPIERLYDRRAGTVVESIIRRKGINIVHVHTPKAGMLVRARAASAGAKVIMHVHGLGTLAHIRSGVLTPYALLKKKMLYTLARLSDRRTDHFIFVCRKDMMESEISNDISTLVYNGVDIGKWNYDDPPDTNTLIFPARLSVQKDPATLLLALQILVKRGFALKLLMPKIGDSAEQIIKLVSKLSLQNFIEFIEPDEDMKTAFKRASITVLSSHWEGQPISILEAMAAGRPVISTDIGGISETLGDCGLLVPRKNPEALADAIALLFNEKDKRIELARRARRRVEEHFPIQRMIQGVAEVYRKVLP